MFNLNMIICMFFSFLSCSERTSLPDVQLVELGTGIAENLALDNGEAFYIVLSPFGCSSCLQYVSKIVELHGNNRTTPELKCIISTPIYQAAEAFGKHANLKIALLQDSTKSFQNYFSQKRKPVFFHFKQREIKSSFIIENHGNFEKIRQYITNLRMGS